MVTEDAAVGASAAENRLSNCADRAAVDRRGAKGHQLAGAKGTVDGESMADGHMTNMYQGCRHQH